MWSSPLIDWAVSNGLGVFSGTDFRFTQFRVDLVWVESAPLTVLTKQMLYLLCLRYALVLRAIQFLIPGYKCQAPCCYLTVKYWFQLRGMERWDWMRRIGLRQKVSMTTLRHPYSYSVTLPMTLFKTQLVSQRYVVLFNLIITHPNNKTREFDHSADRFTVDLNKLPHDGQTDRCPVEKDLDWFVAQHINQL